MDKHNSLLVFEQSLEALSQTQGDIASFPKIYDQIDELQQMLSSLEAKTTEHEQAFQNDLKPVEALFGTLKDNSEMFQGQASGLFDQVKSQNSDFYETVNGSLESLRQKLGECFTQASSLNEQGQSLNEEFESQLQEVQANTTGFQSLLEEVKGEFETRKSSLLEGFESIEQEAQVRLQKLTENYSTLLDEGNNHLHELESLLDNTSGEAILVLSRKFEEEILTQLTQSAGELSQLIEGVGSAGEASQDLLQGEVGSMLDKLSEVTQLIEQIKPILDLVKEML
jgi:predicted  nucleic acid-binding Zn-ribbon protein